MLKETDSIGIAKGKQWSNDLNLYFFINKEALKRI
jgi:hypothetical protein